MKTTRVAVAVGATTLAFVFGALVGCRGVLGVEDLDLQADGGAASTGDAKVDSPVSSGDASTTDAAAQVDPKTCSSSATCPQCCHGAKGSEQGFPAMWAAAKSSGCVCGAGACTAASECAADVCIGSTGQPKMGCPECIDMRVTMAAGACGGVKAACSGNADCIAMVDCITSCKPP